MLGYLYAFLVALAYGTSAIYMKIGLQNIPSQVGVIYSVGVNALLASLVAIFLLGFNPIEINLQGIIILIVSGLLGPVLGRKALYQAINLIGVNKSSAIKISAPFFSVFLAFLFLSEKINLLQALGMSIVVLGLYFFSPIETFDKTSNTDQINHSIAKKGFIFSLIAAFCFAAGNTFRKLGLQYIDSAIISLAISTSGAFLFYFAVYLYKGDMKYIIIKDHLARKNIIIGSIFATAATFCYFLALKTIPVAIAVTLANTEPIFIIFLGKYIFGLDEKISLSLIRNITIIFIGVLMIVLN